MMMERQWFLVMGVKYGCILDVLMFQMIHMDGFAIPVRRGKECQGTEGKQLYNQQSKYRADTFNTLACFKSQYGLENNIDFA